MLYSFTYDDFPALTDSKGPPPQGNDLRLHIKNRPFFKMVV